MTLKDFANVDSLYRDKETGMEVEHEEFMNRIIGKLGIENIKPYIPYSLDILKEKVKEDKYFNNTSIQQWDEASGFWFHNGNVYPTGTGLMAFLRLKGITRFAPSQCVSILKTAARMLCEMEM